MSSLPSVLSPHPITIKREGGGGNLSSRLQMTWLTLAHPHTHMNVCGQTNRQADPMSIFALLKGTANEPSCSCLPAHQMASSFRHPAVVLVWYFPHHQSCSSSETKDFCKEMDSSRRRGLFLPGWIKWCQSTEGQALSSLSPHEAAVRVGSPVRWRGSTDSLLALETVGTSPMGPEGYCMGPFMLAQSKYSKTQWRQMQQTGSTNITIVLLHHSGHMGSEI